MKEEKLSKTMWFGPITNYANSSDVDILNQLLNEEITGLIKKPIRFRIVKSKIGLASQANKISYLFVEFEN